MSTLFPFTWCKSEVRYIREAVELTDGYMHVLCCKNGWSKGEHGVGRRVIRTYSSMECGIKHEIWGRYWFMDICLNWTSFVDETDLWVWLTVVNLLLLKNSLFDLKQVSFVHVYIFEVWSMTTSTSVEMYVDRLNSCWKLPESGSCQNSFQYIFVSPPPLSFLL